MRVLLVEPKIRKTIPKLNPSNGEDAQDHNLWYPPLGLLKLSRFHRKYKDDVEFVYGCDDSLFKNKDLFSEGIYFDRIYISSVFTYQYDIVMKTIKFYKEAVGGTVRNIYVGGIMASLIPDDLRSTKVQIIEGIIDSPKIINLFDEKYPKNCNIDLLPPDYDILLKGKYKNYYAIHETFYGYTTKGCPYKCPWCGVHKIEPEFIEYIDIKKTIKILRRKYGDKPILKLMDNNVLASKRLKHIVKDLVDLGYGRGQLTKDGKQRVVDFNQGMDATHLTENKMSLLSELNIKPMRIAFDRISDKKDYLASLKLAADYGVRVFSNYMLYNCNDSPKDLYDRLSANIELNEEWKKNKIDSHVYSYPMRFAPIFPINGKNVNHQRDYVPPLPFKPYDLLNNACWTHRFIRNIEIMKGAAHGAISPTSSLAWRTLGINYKTFLANLYMPEEFLRNRNKHEKKNYGGSGNVERFRMFILNNIKRPSADFWEFHKAVSQNKTSAIKKYLSKCKKKEYKKWLQWYLRNEGNPEQLDPSLEDRF